MNNELLKRSIDLLLNEFYKKGYITVSRRQGKYLPDPAPIGGYTIDILAKRGKDFALGIVLDSIELRNPSVRDKIEILASRRTKFSNRTVPLFIGVEPDSFSFASELIATLDTAIQENIELFSLEEQISVSLFQQGKNIYSGSYSFR